MSKDLSIIIPFLNEEDSMQMLVKEIDEFNKKHSFNLEVIFIDDGSTDQSVEKLKEEFTNINDANWVARIVRFSKNYGSPIAVRAGNNLAKYDVVTIVDADLEFIIDQLSDMYDLITKGNKLVFSTKEDVRSVPLLDRVFSRIFAFIFSRFVLKNYPQKGFANMMYTKDIKEALNNNSDPSLSPFLEVLNTGIKIVYIEARLRKRQFGVSKWSFSKKIKLLIDSFVAYSYLPIRLISLLGITFSMMGFIYALYIIVSKAFFHTQFSLGFPTMISVMLIGFGITNITLGITAEYLWRTLEASRKRPLFIIEEDITLNHIQDKRLTI